MALFPVQGLFAGDFVVLLVPIDDADPMTTVAEKVAHHSINRRIPAQDRPMQVRFNGEVLAPDATAITSGLTPLDFLEVSYQ